MKYICNSCGKVFQANDITIHYIKGDNGLEIFALCSSCLENYLEKIKLDTEQKENNAERMKMKRKW